MRNFFITLPSNASMDFYKENKTSQFTVKLPNKLHIQNFKVGLSEIHIPNNLRLVTFCCCKKTIKSPSTVEYRLYLLRA